MPRPSYFDRIAGGGPGPEGMLSPPRILFRPASSPMELTTALEVEVAVTSPAAVPPLEGETAAGLARSRPAPVPPPPGVGSPPKTPAPIVPGEGGRPRPMAVAAVPEPVTPGPVAAVPAPAAPRPIRAEVARPVPAPRASAPDGPRGVERPRPDVVASSPTSSRTETGASDHDRPGPDVVVPGPARRRAAAALLGPRARAVEVEAGEGVSPAVSATHVGRPAAAPVAPPAMAAVAAASVEPRAAGPRPVTAANEAVTRSPEDSGDRPRGPANGRSTIRLEPPAVSPPPRRPAVDQPAARVRIGSLEVRITPRAAEPAPAAPSGSRPRADGGPGPDGDSGGSAVSRVPSLRSRAGMKDEVAPP